MYPFEVVGETVIQERVSTLLIVEAFGVAEDAGSSLLLSLVDVALYLFGLECGEERFDHSKESSTGGSIPSSIRCVYDQSIPLLRTLLS